MGSDCRASIDGWCETHSTGAGPAWCVDALKDALRRARFHERENYAREQEATRRAERFRLAWISARGRRHNA